VGAGSVGIIFDDLEWSTPNPGFKVTGYLKVEYLADGVRVFNCTKHSCRSLGALPKTCKNWGSSLKFFFAKSTGWCFTPVIEIKPNSVSLRWNFYAYIQLIRGRFWLQLWTVKKLSETRVSWKYLAKMWKKSKMRSQFAATLRRWADGRSLFRRTALLGVPIALFTTPRRPRRWRALNSEFSGDVWWLSNTAKSRNGPKMVPCLLISTDR